MEMEAEQDVQMQDAEQRQHDQAPVSVPDQQREPEPEPNPDDSAEQEATGDLDTERNRDQGIDDAEEQEEEGGEGEGEGEGEGDAVEEDEDEEDEEEADDDDDDGDGDGEPSQSDASDVEVKAQQVQKPRGRPRGRPKGSGSKIHRGQGRGPLTLSRRGRGRPRVNHPPPRGTGRTLYQGTIINGTSENTEGAEGAEDGEAGEPQQFGGSITVAGKEYQLVGDELVLESDEDGDKKIDAKGNLLGGREWKPHTFCSPMRPDPECLYVLSIDAARAAGYRDSLYFFRKNPLLVKLNLMQGEKDVLIDGGRLSGTLRGRNVTMVAARNVFKLHGPRMVKNGRAVTDDYYEAKARAAGKKEGEKVGPAEVDDPAAARRELDKQRERARKARDVHLHQSTDPNGEPVYTQFCDAGEAPFVRAEGWLLKRQQLARSGITEKNWKLEMAKSVRGINHEFTEVRKARKERWEWDWEGGEPLPEDSEKEKNSGDIIGKLTGSSKSTPNFRPESSIKQTYPVGGYTRRSFVPGSFFGPQSQSQSSTQNAAKRALEEQEAKAAEVKKAKLDQAPLGVYDPYTGQIHFPRSLQSERARLEKISARARFEAPPGSYSSSKSTAPILGGVRVGRAAWGLASFEHRLSEANLPPPPGARAGDSVLPAGEPMDSNEEMDGARASAIPEEQDGGGTPDPSANHLATSAPQNKTGPNKKLGRAGQGLIARADLWKAR